MLARPCAALVHTFVFAVVVLSASATVLLDNTKLPVDQNGNQIITGEADVLFHNGTYYFYFNDWGTCPGVDCCDSSAGCAGCCQTKPPHPLMPGCTDPNNGSNPYGLYHQVVGYSTVDFNSWENMGVVLPLALRQPGQLMRPHTLYNAKMGRFVLWYEDRPESGYSVAVSDVPQGPFRTINRNVAMPGSGRIGDFDLFMDDDGVAYHVRTGFDVVKLDENFTGAAISLFILFVVGNIPKYKYLFGTP